MNNYLMGLNVGGIFNHCGFKKNNGTSFEQSKLLTKKIKLFDTP